MLLSRKSSSWRMLLDRIFSSPTLPSDSGMTAKAYIICSHTTHNIFKSGGRVSETLMCSEIANISPFKIFWIYFCIHHLNLEVFFKNFSISLMTYGNRFFMKIWVYILQNITSAQSIIIMKVFWILNSVLTILMNILRNMRVIYSFHQVLP